MSTSSLTHITPLPADISRRAAVAQLHDHQAMIEMNPLVIRHVPTSAPPMASEDEAQHATWYEITDRINYLPGGLWSGEISYHACFFDRPDGLQTHVFAPMGVDIRGKWSVRGNMPGEPREEPELGINAPREGLYIVEEVVLRCGMLLTGFIKRNLKRSHSKVVEKVVAAAQAWSQEHESHRMQTLNGSDFDTADGSWRNADGQPSLLAAFATSSNDISTPQELEGSPATDRCLCTGALHEQRCSSYPNLRQPQPQAL